MNLEISNKRFLVTGSSHGIGRAIAEKLLEEGANTGLVARTETSLSDTARSLAKKFGEEKVDHWVADFTRPESVQNVKNSIVRKWGRLDGLVANIGDGRSVPDPIPSHAQWSSVWSKNFESALHPVRAFLPMLAESKGSIVFISSICGVEALGAPVDYSVAKSAIHALAKNLSHKVGTDVRVNVVAPGNVFFPGGSWDQKIQDNSQAVENMINNQVPMKRFGTPEEIADAVAFLSSARASFITGAILCVDGGQTLNC